MTELLDSVTLKNGLQVRFVDQSRRYFGDFHRICIKVEIALPADFELSEGVPRDTAVFEKHLEKMGVLSAEVSKEKERLIRNFLVTSKCYLETSDFPLKLLKKMQQRRRKGIFP